MRVVLTTPYCWPEVRRGGERIVHELAAGLQRAGHDVSLLSTASVPSTGEVLGVPIRRLPSRRLAPHRFGDQSAEVGFGGQALLRLASRRIDVWHAVGIPDGAAAAIAGRIRPGVRSVFTDMGFPAAASRRRRRDHRLQVLMTRWIDAYCCLSHSAGEWLERDYGRKATVVHPGVEFSRYEPAAREARPTVVFSGQLDEPRKHLDLLLGAAELLAQRVPDLQLWLLGQGDAGPALAAAGRFARQAVTVCGAVDDEALRQRYARAWTLVLPSVAESFGLVVIEALASGTPVVVRADSGGPAEIVGDEPVGVVSGPTVEELADSIERSLQRAHEPDAVAACRAVAARYDWDRTVVPAMERVYGDAA